MMEKGFMLLAFQTPKWAEEFESEHGTSYTCEEILEKARRLEQKYIVWERLTSAASFFGMVMMILGGLFGEFLALQGLFLGLFLVAQMTRFHSIHRCDQKLSMLHILWDIRKREEEALINSEIQDL